MGTSRSVPSYCFNCVSGPDFLRVRVEDGVARCVEPNHEGADVHPALGRPCVRAYVSEPANPVYDADQLTWNFVSTGYKSANCF